MADFHQACAAVPSVPGKWPNAYSCACSSYGAKSAVQSLKTITVRGWELYEVRIILSWVAGSTRASMTIARRLCGLLDWLRRLTDSCVVDRCKNRCSLEASLRQSVIVSVFSGLTPLTDKAPFSYARPQYGPSISVAHEIPKADNAPLQQLRGCTPNVLSKN